LSLPATDGIQRKADEFHWVKLNLGLYQEKSVSEVELGNIEDRGAGYEALVYLSIMDPFYIGKIGFGERPMLLLGGARIGKNQTSCLSIRYYYGGVKLSIAETSTIYKNAVVATVKY
ncbi:MAG: hypothetical protein QME61_02250, partial [Patescibacteria group bacterium]|nr:hypothetical protein [Patescibacteria group bacterium]